MGWNQHGHANGVWRKRAANEWCSHGEIESRNVCQEAARPRVQAASWAGDEAGEKERPRGGLTVQLDKSALHTPSRNPSEGPA